MSDYQIRTIGGLRETLKVYASQNNVPDSSDQYNDVKRAIDDLAREVIRQLIGNVRGTLNSDGCSVSDPEAKKILNQIKKIRS